MEIRTQARPGGKQANPVETFLFFCHFTYHPQLYSGYNAGNLC
jgi:hypothetical protein